MDSNRGTKGSRMSPLGVTARNRPGQDPSSFEARRGPEPGQNRIPDPPQIRLRSRPRFLIFDFFDKNVKKTKFCQMIDLTISNSSIAGRPPNSDFLIGFWPGENWSVSPPPEQYQKKLNFAT